MLQATEKSAFFSRNIRYQGKPRWKMEMANKKYLNNKNKIVLKEIHDLRQ